MPVINATTFKGVADRIAAQWILIKAAIIDSKAEGGGKFYTRIHDGVGTGDPVVERDLVRPANVLDDNMSSGLVASSFYGSFINALKQHVSGQGYRSLDIYLNTLGINVSPYFEDVYYLATGSHLDARNVFENPAGTILGTVSLSGSSVGTYVHGTRVGTGTGKVASDNHAASNLKVVPTTTVGGTDIILDLALLSEAPTDGSVAASMQVTIPSGTVAGTVIDVGVPYTNMYLDVTNIRFAGGSASDTLKVVSSAERVEAL